MNRSIILAATAVFLLCLPAAAFADDISGPYIFELFQQDQNVRVNIWAAENGEPHSGGFFRLDRHNPAENKRILDDHQFDLPQDASESSVECMFENDEIDCNATPDLCDDCDQNGTPECTGTCELIYHFEVLDLCVPPGLTDYTLYAKEEANYDYDEMDEESIDVTDSGEPCDQDGDDDDDDSGKCSLSAGNTDIGLFTAMLLAGLTATLISRRRKA